jgi:predicted GH43/DUF377 family glycosyl hydrolase
MSATAWSIGPFTRRGEVLRQRANLSFDCPVAGASVAWAEKDVFNPAAVVHEGRLHLLFRAEDAVGRYSGTSRLGLASSDDGITFEVEPEPVLYPDDDTWQAWEWPGGCEDPRVVESPDGGFVCLYTAFDGKSGSLFVATSADLRHWDKRGPAFDGTPYVRRLSKSGAVVTEVVGDRLVAARIGDRFLMYWGEGTTYGAISEDLIHWTPLEFDPGSDRYLSYRTEDGTGSWDIHRVPGQRVLRPLLFPRPERFDALLTEPGPPAVRTEDGVVLIYNGAEILIDGTSTSVAYQPGQVLFDPSDPFSPLVRDHEPMSLLGPVEQLEGQVDNVCFAEGLALFKGEWFLYYGMADSRIGCASAPGPATGQR